MKIVTFLLFLLFISSSATAKEAHGCQDFLLAMNLKPTELVFNSCKQVERPPAVLLESSYSVSGKHAKKIENLLHKAFAFERLRFVCCGFESRDATYVDIKGDTYSINMYSYDEFNFQEKWEDYKEFRVIIGKYLVLP